MQFSRSNFQKSSGSSQPDDGEEETAPEVYFPRPPSVDPNQVSIEEAPWQSAFTLAPNVRFTRTPESALTRAKHGGEQVEAPAEQRFIEMSSDVYLTSASGRYAANEQPPAGVIAELEQIASVMRQAVVEERVEIVEESSELASEAITIDQVEPAVMTRPELAISDHAFWEVMPFDIEVEEATAAVEKAPAPAHEAPRRLLDSSVNSVTALYREVAQSARPTAVATRSRSIQPMPSFRPAPVQPSAPAVLSAVREPAPAMQTVCPTLETTTATELPRPRPRVPVVAEYEFPPISLLQQPVGDRGQAMQPDALQQSAGLLESILEDFGVRGEIIDVRPGPVVTLYEFEPAPGVKSSRVIGLADDIARSMSALSARVAVVPGRNVIGIELPNATRETVYFRELIECEDYWETKHRLALCLGKTIGGEPVIAELAKMPHLLVAGTTGSGKSVAINTMILSLLYRLRPEECRLIMIDPKMLELSVYDGIPHLLTPVVTDPRKAVLALKWAVREMEDRYRKMSRLGVRNIDGYNQRAAQAREKGEVITVSVQSGFDRTTGEIVYEEQELDLSPMPYIVVIVDEMADLMMVAGKDIEGAIQRLAQMARAAGIHLIMATQRPSVDVITGTIKANFPTRISFQVTSKIDSRTILGEQGAEHLLGQGDMLHMAGGGRISRVHGPFVSDAEVEQVVRHLKTQGQPDYLGTVTEDEGEGDEEGAVQEAVFDKGAIAGEDGDELYERAVKIVMKDRKCSTSYIQRRLSIGYNKAASLVERMEQEGLVGPANHVGKREIIRGPGMAVPDDTE
ncbi:DNA translocase FtsK [Rhizobium sp. LC145]|uniref:DNA translocase FtsK n=1 Tax=Rhizobium sp. LC145 TaxID=1120688 RepID=UPI0009E48746|nr:DNA translocase FtsK [Rhizobium sp. LC145]TKT55994.1 DNA translocase FtsK [Rhizobiaceae bacterium LC148]